MERSEKGNGGNMKLSLSAVFFLLSIKIATCYDQSFVGGIKRVSLPVPLYFYNQKMSAIFVSMQRFDQVC